MIQRIQTLWLLIAFALQISLYFLPVSSAKTLRPEKQEITAQMNVYKLEVSNGPKAEQKVSKIVLFPLVLNSILAILILLSLFLYKKRPLQYQLSRFLILVDLGLITGLVFAIEDFKKAIPVSDFAFSYDPACAFPVLSIVLIFLAGRAIMKDEELVKDSSRLR